VRDYKPIQLRILCEIEDADIAVRNVYVKIQAEERIQVVDYDIEFDGNTQRDEQYQIHPNILR